MDVLLIRVNAKVESSALVTLIHYSLGLVSVSLRCVSVSLLSISNAILHLPTH